ATAWLAGEVSLSRRSAIPDGEAAVGDGEIEERSFPGPVPTMRLPVDADVRAHGIDAQCRERPCRARLRQLRAKMASRLARARRHQASARAGRPGGLERLWRRERDSNPRYPMGTTDFESAAIDHSAISPRSDTSAGFYQGLM